MHNNNINIDPGVEHERLRKLAKTDEKKNAAMRAAEQAAAQKQQ